MVAFVIKNPIDLDLARFVRRGRCSPMKKNAFVRFYRRDRAGTGSRVTGSPGQWLWPGRVGSRVKVIYLQTRYHDPVSDRRAEWYSSSCFYAWNTMNALYKVGAQWTHVSKCHS